MDSNNKKNQIREALATLAAAHTHAVAEIEEAIERLISVLEIQERSETSATGSLAKDRRPKVDRETLSITWKNQSCFLGNTLPFLFFERLARSPNRYVSHLDLLEDVWGEEREAATIRGVVKRLRDMLHKAGMSQLAEAIDGSVTGYYGLIFV